MGAMANRLTWLWRRLTHCPRGDHRDTVECEFGILQYRCLDCGALDVLGFVFLHVSNKAPHHYRPDQP